jgi:VIT1/CCC1 family predicted Fe2+/Mn2+ transporter
MDRPSEKTHAPPEPHLVNRIGWLRAAVLGADDGILSIASILTGVAAGGAPRRAILLAGLAGLVAGATSMATGEYVSVSSQADTENADLAREKKELAYNPKYEQEELAQIYVTRGLELSLARQVAAQLTEHDALGAHARDELGISQIAVARPVQAALASAASFTCGAFLPLLTAMIAPPQYLIWSVVITSLSSLALLGALGAKTGGVKILMPTMRVLLWGALSMALTSLVGTLFPLNP